MNRKKKLCSSLALVMAVSSTLSAVQIQTIAAATDVDCTISAESITLENPKIARTFSIQDGHIQTTEILNKKINRSLLPDEGSEDFVINTLNQIAADDEGLIENNPVYDNPEPLDSTLWQAVLTNKDGQEFPQSQVRTLFDGDPNTYIDYYQISGMPFTLDIDLGQVETIAAMSIDKRPGYHEDGWGINGTIGDYELWSSEDGESWNQVMEGSIQQSDWNLHLENGLYNTGDQIHINLPEAIQTRHLRLVQTSVSLGSAEEFTMAELDFYAQPLDQQAQEVLPTQPLDRSAWTGTITNASGQSFDAGSFEKLIDGDLNTYPDQYKYAGFPISITIDMQEPQTVSSLSLDKRPGYPDQQYGINGTIGKYQVYTSDDGQTWTFNGTGNIPEEAWNLHQEGNLYNVGDTVYVNLRKEVTARYFRIVQLSDGLGGTQEMTMSEVNLYADPYTGPDYRTDEGMEAEIPIRSSELIFRTAVCTDMEDGKKLTIQYEPFTQNGITWNIDEVFVLENGKDYMRSFLEITTDDPVNAVIDYIDQDAFVIGEADLDTVWSHPDENGMSSATIAAFELMLGQPVYAGGFYMGSEFPATDTRVNDDTVQVRYYSGKNFEKLAEDNQLTTDGKFVSWQNVVGSARGVTEAEVQTDFFNYIEEIATPTEFRKQYNSWYDNMMTITDESIEKSFTEVEKALAAQGVEPLDSYVVDDGWNTYYDGTYNATPGTDRGTTPNQTGFWEVNDKFPNDFYTSSLLASKLQSTFGIWIGPQGGYNYYSGFSQLMEEKGTGYSQTNGYLGRNICTGSRKYIKNFETLANDWEERYGTSYWKWDGFAGRPCTNASHDHMTGGYHNMYYTSDMWEAWTDLFENVREKAASLDQDLFINATCYVNLSPWLLQWVNTIWLQESGDTGQTGTGERHEQKIYYRDSVYYNLLKEKNVQFPVNHLYDHDPIYGVSDNSSATDETWREYMLANAMRGTAFWELYYSPSIMNEEKYAITADVLDFAQENHETLKKAKLFGAKAPNGVYGYSSWNGTEGIVSFTNPLSTAASYDLVLDAQVGVESVAQNLKGVQVEPYVSGTLETTVSYGDSFHVELEPHETKIFHFTDQDFGQPEVLSADAISEKSVKIRFDRRIDPVQFTALEESADFELLDDYRSVVVTFHNAVPASLDLEYTVKNEAGDVYEGSRTIALAGNGVLLNTAIALPEQTNLVYNDLDQTLLAQNLQETEISQSLANVNTFTLETAIVTEQSDLNLFSYGDALSLRIDEDGFVIFDLNGVSATSKAVETKVLEKVSGIFGTDDYRWQTTQEVVTGRVNDGTPHRIAAMKEANGMLKIYVDGQLAGTAYTADLETYVLPAGSVVLSENGFGGAMMPVKISSKALSIAEVKGNAAADWESVMLDRANWTAQACSEENGTSGDANAMAALDGNTGSWWHTNYRGLDSHALTEHWIQIDFGQEETFDTFWYTGRGASTNGSIKDYILELLDEDGNVLETVSGTFENANKAAVRFGENKTASAIRLRPVSTWNGANYAAAVEIELSVAATDFTEEELEQAKADALAKVTDFDPSAATTLTGNALQAVIQKVENCVQSNSIAWAQLMEELDRALENLVEAPELKEAIEKAAPIMAGTPSEDQAKWTAFVEAWQKAQAAMYAGSREECLAAAQDLSAAQNDLDLSEVAVNKTLLKMAIEYAQEKQASDALDQLNEIVVARFESALANAISVYEDEAATQNEVNDAWLQLTRVIQMLEFKADKTALNELIATCEAMDLTGVVQDEAYEAYLVALEAAKNTAARDTALQESIEKAYTELLAAKDSLHFASVDTSLLAYLISVIDEEDLDAYVPGDTMDAFLVILAQARDVLLAPESQDQVDTMTSTLNTAWLNLRLKPSEEMLQQLASFVEQVSTLSLETYSEADAAILRDLQARATALLNDPAATKEDAQALLTQISSDAIQNLLTAGTTSVTPSVTPADATTGTEKSVALQSVKTAVQSGVMAFVSAGLAGAAALLALTKRRNKKQ